MKKKTTETALIDLTSCIVEAMEDKKAHEIVSIDLRKLTNPVADVFIICHGTSDRQVESIAENIEKHVFLKLKQKPSYREGYENKEWILLDFFDIIVHVFQENKKLLQMEIKMKMFLIL